MADRFPGYDVLAKRGGASWNELTRRVVDKRMALREREDVLDAEFCAVLRAVVDRIVPQPEGRVPVNAVALVLEKIAEGGENGHRHHRMPPLRQAWEQGLAAIDAEAVSRTGQPFAGLSTEQQDGVLRAVEKGETASPAWDDLPAEVFFFWRLLPDIVTAYYAHPSAWSAMGFGGPASPRGYVRMEADRRDPWEAAEARDGRLIPARIRNRYVE